ncbi:Uncharacterised protein (plasmid) [Legionella adelaidensis]|uniref:Transmembrane protein n=1 Tax=Legionella adelaidensis TaxID=45056 RepID=A0A0W0R414_9GAMM|nr:hypothetical protein [Legionella adelaidensis]KTC65825.1 hypothetical protein Lade_0483 [Legionella adelaidensis]VEH85255.1 Uncharacterised protein [Legionella adelaidensis]
MFILSAILFAIAALLGAFLASKVLRNKETPKAVAFIHGGVAAVALIILILAALMVPAMGKGIVVASIILFAIVAMGGFFLIYKDLTAQEIPKPVVLVHGSFAVLSFILLLYFIFNYL